MGWWVGGGGGCLRHHLESTTLLPQEKVSATIWVAQRLTRKAPEIYKTKRFTNRVGNFLSRYHRLLPNITGTLNIADM
jgi:hypothetical protein